MTRFQFEIIHRQGSYLQPYKREFTVPKDFGVNFSNAKFGPGTIPNSLLDLLDVSFAIYTVERSIKNKISSSNPPVKINMIGHIRDASVWNEESINILCELLKFMGNIVFDITLETIKKKNGENYNFTLNKSAKKIDAIVLFSGGLDSTSGIMSLHEKRNSLHLVTFYSNHKKAQIEIAKALGYDSHSLVSFDKKSDIDLKNTTYLYRSFFFLTIASLLGVSFNTTKIYQFENGVLGWSVPPSPSWRITRHAHPLFHDYFKRLVLSIMGLNLEIENPFKLKTKKEAVDIAKIKYQNKNRDKILSSTETCWRYKSNFHINGESKTPNTNCGICVPCLVRKTAELDDIYDLMISKAFLLKYKNDYRLLEAFQDYYGFVTEIKSMDKYKFFSRLPSYNRQLIAKDDQLLTEIYKLYLRFSDEFLNEFNSALV